MAYRSGGPKVLVIVLAGGEGKRLMPLTADRAKPAVPFGGIYRLIDFALSNVVNSGYLRVVVLTQYKSHSLDRHVTQTWRMSTMLGNYVTPVPAQQRLGPRWFAGSADAIYQNIYTLERAGAKYIVAVDPVPVVLPPVVLATALRVGVLAVFRAVFRVVVAMVISSVGGSGLNPRRRGAL